MSGVSGSKLTELEDRIVAWAVSYQEKIESYLRKDYPYNSVPLEEKESLARFLEMSGFDYAKMVSMLNEKYRGYPDAYDRVNRDLANFLSAMLAAAAKESV